MDEILLIVKLVVKSRGFRVDMHSQYCMRHRKTHENCEGCESYAGCQRFNAVLLLVIARKGQSTENSEAKLDFNSRLDRILSEDCTKNEMLDLAWKKKVE